MFSSSFTITCLIIIGTSGSSDGSSATVLQSLESPMLVVGKGDAIIQMSPTSLRFWEKLGLSPRAGQKDVTAFVFFEGTDEERESEIEGWLGRVSAAYSVSLLQSPSRTLELRGYRQRILVFMTRACPVTTPSQVSCPHASIRFARPSVSIISRVP